MNALQEYRTKLNQIILHFYNFVLNDNEKARVDLEKSIEDCRTEFIKCTQVLTHRHNTSLLISFKQGLEQLDSLKNILFTTSLNAEEQSQMLNQLVLIIDRGNRITEELLNETRVEIDEFIHTNKTAVLHSTITIITLGLILLLIVTIGVLHFIKKLTTPISVLLASTKKVRGGEFNSIVKIDSNDEFNELADSFNSMVTTLEKTTISRNYYDNILENMIELLIVTDNKGGIETINQKATNLLGFSNEDLQYSLVEKLFVSNSQSVDSEIISRKFELKAVSNSEHFLLAKDGRKIPVLLSASVLKNADGEVLKYIFVARDLTEKKAIENKLEMERKEKLIAINDAHEEEKFRIAIDLHDGLGQILTATSYTFQNYFGELNKENIEYHKKVDLIQSQLDAAIKESKNIAHNLIPIALKDFGLIVAINNLIAQANQRSETKFSFETYNFTSRINEKLEKAIFRICQEAINNILKHSKAKNASFQINKYEDAVVVVIEDDGIGFELNEIITSNKLNGIGLIGMRERVMAFNGNFTINTKLNSGTEILIEIPCLK